MQVSFVTVDVFTDRPFGGNPLAVILDARGLSDQQMQAIAREFNYSEQTFVLPPEDPAHTARVRIFTPVAELPFAGHPNVGMRSRSPAPARCSAVRSARRDGLRGDRRSGPRRGAARRRHGNRRPHRRAAALEIGSEVPVAPLAACTGLPASAFAAAAHAPRIASVGMRQVFAELPRSRHPCRRAAGPGRLRGRRGRPAARRRTLAPAPLDPDRPRGVRARMFGPTLGMLEDPATGSAAGALGGLLANRGEGEDLVIEQGIEMGRPAASRSPCAG